MKKHILFILILLFLTGCQNKTGTINCTLSSNDEVNGYKLDSEYKINYIDDYVNSVEIIEIFTSNSKDIVDTFETTLNKSYEAMSKTYGGYTYSVIKEGNKLTSKVNINYNEVDIEKYIKDENVLKTYVKAGKILIEGIKETYENMGATCK